MLLNGTKAPSRKIPHIGAPIAPFKLVLSCTKLTWIKIKLIKNYLQVLTSLLCTFDINIDKPVEIVPIKTTRNLTTIVLLLSFIFLKYFIGFKKSAQTIAAMLFNIEETDESDPLNKLNILKKKFNSKVNHHIPIELRIRKVL